MNWVKGFFKPRQDNFVRLLTQQAEWTVQGIEGLEKYMKKRSPKHAEQVTVAEKEADEVRRILMAVQRLSDHPNVANDHAVRAKALENRVEQVYREAVADLFHQPQDVEHIVDMLKLREIYRHLSNAADRGDEAANVISDIVVKMT